MVWIIGIGVVQVVMCLALLFVVAKAINALNEYKTTLNAFRDILLKNGAVQTQYQAAIKAEKEKPAAPAGQ